MPKFVQRICKIYADGYDVSGDTNQVSLEQTYDEVEFTPFGSTSHAFYPGIPVVSFSFSGAAESDGTDAIDDIIAAKLSSTSVPVTFCPTDGTAAEICYFTSGCMLNATRGGSVGDMYGFEVSGVGQGSLLVRGTVMEALAAKTSTGTGTARQLGAVTATQKVYAVMHITAVSGTSPTLDMVVQSDDAEGMASASDRITFTQATAIGSQFSSTAGAITDDWWRLSWTIGGSDTPTFTVFVGVGIK